MHVLRLECRAEEKDRLIAELWERGTAGISEEDAPGGRSRLAAFFDRPVDVANLAAWQPHWEIVEDRDWVQVAQSQWSPVLVGERFYLVPAWSREPAPPGRLRLVMNPGQACGTGWHPATQLCLEAMERHVFPGAAVLDLGTGSGILAVAAALLGAGPIYACDIDPDATLAARDRLRQEGVEANLFVGSARSVRSASVDVVVANISAETLLDLAPEIARIRKPAGRAILSGFPRRQLDRVQAAYSAHSEVIEKEGWIALVCRLSIT
ncbi:MAG: 50S ribosomal protein L11 methyltransferase [Bryobacteraceae bacterium]|jgi:ribosomal protein L11 methyltransferase